MSFKSTKNINLVTFGEEFFHGYQDLFYNGLGQHSNTGRSNIEFEAKLYHDMTNGGQCCITFGGVATIGTEYFIWLSDVTQNFTTLPNWTVISNKYYYFLEKFIEHNPYYNYPINYNLLPNALLNINDC